MTKEHNYTCSVCDREVGRSNLIVKRTEFRAMGKGGKIIKSRTTGWLCNVLQDDGSPSCIEKDPDWARPLYGAAPGHVDTVLADELGVNQ